MPTNPTPADLIAAIHARRAGQVKREPVAPKPPPASDPVARFVADANARRSKS